MDAIEDPYDYAMVLIGRPNRINRGLQLYKQGKARKLCILGRSLNQGLRAQLIDLGIADEDLLLETKSRNTYEHALYFREFLEKEEGVSVDTSSLLIITTASHMRRSELCFKKQEISADLMSVNYISQDRNHYRLLDMLPNPMSMYHWQHLIKEVTGMITYRVMGYL